MSLLLRNSPYKSKKVDTQVIYQPNDENRLKTIFTHSTRYFSIKAKLSLLIQDRSSKNRLFVNHLLRTSALLGVTDNELKQKETTND